MKPSKKANAGIIDRTNIEEIKTHVVSPVFIQSDVELGPDISRLRLSLQIVYLFDTHDDFFLSSFYSSNRIFIYFR